MTSLLVSLLIARRAIRDADFAALDSASPASHALIEQLEAAMNAIDLAILEVSMPEKFCP